MKTVFVPTSPAPYGGSLRWLDTFCEMLPRRGWRIVLGVPNDSRWPRSKFLESRPNADVIELNSRTHTAEARRRSIRRAIRRLNPDVVIPHLIADALPAIGAMKREKDSLRLVVRCQEVYPPMLADAIAWSPAIDAVVVVGRLLENIVATMTDLPKARILRAPGGVKSRVVLSQNRPRQEGPIRIGYAGRLDDDKRIMDMIPFCEALDSRGVAYSLDIVGGGSREHELRLALAGRVADGKARIAGIRSQEELYSEFYPAWDALVLFSPAEGLSFVALEAMIHGVVPVVSDFTGRATEGILRQGETAKVFPVGDLDAAANCVAELYADRKSLGRLGERGRDEVVGRYTDEDDIDAWENLLNLVIESPPRNSAVQIPVSAPSGRLERWFGSSAGDVLRGLLRPDTSAQSWPMASHSNSGLIQRVARAIGVLEQTRAGEDSARPVFAVP